MDFVGSLNIPYTTQIWLSSNGSNRIDNFPPVHKSMETRYSFETLCFVPHTVRSHFMPGKSSMQTSHISRQVLKHIREFLSNFLGIRIISNFAQIALFQIRIMCYSIVLVSDVPRNTGILIAKVNIPLWLITSTRRRMGSGDKAPSILNLGIRSE
jgi:hypothetical protein